MIVEANATLRDWLAQASGSGDVVDGLPDDAHDGVSFYLYSVARSTDRGNGQTSDAEFELRYLVTADDAAVMDALFGAAVKDVGLDVDGAPRSPDFWLALGIAPRPALVVIRRAIIDVERTPAPMVRHPMQIRHQPVAAVSGRVVGPDDMPLPRAEVVLRSTGEVRRTDKDGTFMFRAVPSEFGKQSLIVRVKGREVAAPVVEPGRQTRPLIIHVTAKEMEDAHV